MNLVSCQALYGLEEKCSDREDAYINSSLPLAVTSIPLPCQGGLCGYVMYVQYVLLYC